MTERVISQSLIEQYGEAIFQAAAGLIASRRAETEFSGYKAPENRRIARERPVPRPAPPGELPERAQSPDFGATGQKIRRAPENGLAAVLEDRKGPNGRPGPGVVKIWPLMGLQAIRAGQGGAWRIWALARALDPEGSGAVMWCDLRRLCNRLGVPGRKLRRWLAEARAAGMLREIERRSGRVLVLSGAPRVAAALGCAGVGGRPVDVPADGLVQSGYRSIVWAGFLATFDGRPVSREKLRELSGVPEQTQRDYERELPIETTANYAITDRPADHLAGVREFERPHAFEYKPKRGRGVVAFRLPDSRSVPCFLARPGRKGRSRKVNQALRAGLSSEGRALSADAIRLFHETHKAAKSTIRQLSRMAAAPSVREVYERRPRGRFQGARVASWSVEVLL